MRIVTLAVAVGLIGCGPAFSAAEATGDGGASDAVQASPEAALQGEDSGPDAREELAVHVVTTHDGGEAGQIVGGGDGAHEANATPPVCLSTLNGVGTADFSISFTLTTMYAAGQVVALVNQRAGCDQNSVWWQAAINSGGGVLFATCDGAGTCEGVTGNAVNDGKPHHVVLDRVAGVITCSVDGVIGSTAPDAYSFGAFGAALRIGTDACGDTPLAGYGTLADLCITSP